LKKKCKVLKITEEEYENASISIDNREINGIQHITFGCPKCNTIIAVPVETLKLFLIIKRKQAGLV
jgi:hypothetical protein